MIIKEQSVRFDGNRMPVPRSVRVGYEGDHLVERLIFEVPDIDDEQTVFWVLSGEYADMAMLEQDADGRYFVDLTAEMLGDGGVVDCYVQVRGADGTVWNSGVLKMRVGELPDADGDLIEREPTIVEQVVQAAERAEAAAREVQNTMKGAARLDDSVVSKESVWSSAATVERLCPAFEESGAVVHCHPVAGYPLGVVSGIEAVQTGEGDPSPENIRPILGHDAVVLSVNEKEYEAAFGRAVYSGTYDWKSGVLTEDKFAIVYDGTEQWGAVANAELCVYTLGSYDYDPLRQLPDGQTTLTYRYICSHFEREAISDSALRSDRTISVYNGARGKTVAIRYTACADVDEWKAYLAAQYAAGTPVMSLHDLVEPQATQGTGRVIAAADGENVLYSSTGDTTVSGRSDPAWAIGGEEDNGTGGGQAEEDVYEIITRWTAPADYVANMYQWTGLAHKKLVVVVEAKAGEADSTLEFLYNYSSLGYTNGGVKKGSAAMTTGIIESMLVRDGGTNKRYLSARCPDNSFVSDTAQSSWRTRGFGAPFRLEVPVGGIDNVAIRVASGTTLPEGSTVTIYGVKV